MTLRNVRVLFIMTWIINRSVSYWFICIERFWNGIWYQHRFASYSMFHNLTHDAINLNRRLSIIESSAIVIFLQVETHVHTRTAISSFSTWYTIRQRVYIYICIKSLLVCYSVRLSIQLSPHHVPVVFLWLALVPLLALKIPIKKM